MTIAHHEVWPGRLGQRKPSRQAPPAPAGSLGRFRSVPPAPSLPKSEIRGPKPEGSPKSEVRRKGWNSGQAVSEATNLSGFGLRISFGFRASDFGFGRLACGGTCKKRPGETRHATSRETRLCVFVPESALRRSELLLDSSRPCVFGRTLFGAPFLDPPLTTNSHGPVLLV